MLSVGSRLFLPISRAGVAARATLLWIESYISTHFKYFRTALAAISATLKLLYRMHFSDFGTTLAALVRNGITVRDLLEIGRNSLEPTLSIC